MSQVKVQIKKDTDTKRIFMTVLLQSARPNASGDIWSKRDIEMFGKTEKELDYEIHVVAGALAEHQNDNSGDRHDPEEVVKAVKEAFEEALVNLDQALQDGTVVDSGIINQ